MTPTNAGLAEALEKCVKQLQQLMPYMRTDVEIGPDCTDYLQSLIDATDALVAYRRHTAGEHMKYQPTMNFRWLVRIQPNPSRDLHRIPGSPPPTFRTLQQGCAPEGGGQIEWRDVPVVEASQQEGG